MRKVWTWGGEPELSVAPDILQRPVDVYDTAAIPISQYEPADKSSRRKPSVALLFHGAGHYDLLVPAQWRPQLQSKL